MTRRVRPSAVATHAQTRALAERADEVVATLRAAVGAPARPHGSPALIVMMGFPGAGKSHAARILAEHLGAAHVASDHLRSQLFVAASYRPEENAAVFAIVDRLLGRLLDEGHRVIVDATHLRADTRRSVATLAERRGVPIAYVLVSAEEADVLARLAARRAARAPDDRSDADERVYRAMKVRGFEPPAEHLTIRSGPDIEREVGRVARELEARWSAGT